MANLKEVRDRIQSVISTQKITKAMKMVAAAKLRRAQTAIVQLRPYSEKLNSILTNILSNLDENESAVSLAQERTVKNALVVVETSNRGLCGAFNSNVMKEVAKLVEGKYNDQYNAGNLHLLTLGKKGFDLLPKRFPKLNVISDYTDMIEKADSALSADIASQLIEGFENETYDVVEIVYASFKNAALQDFKVERFLPIQKLERSEEQAPSKFFIFEPPTKELLEHLVPTILKTQLLKTMLDSNASEQGARMTAMDSATENANDLLKELRISYNKARQEAITNEISEIVGGSAALEGA